MKQLIQMLSGLFASQPTKTENDLSIPKMRTVYPVKGYEALTEDERFQLIAEGCAENKLILRKD